MAAQCCGEMGAEVVCLNRKSSRADQALESLSKAVSACIYVYGYVCMYVCVYACMYTCMCVVCM